MRKRNKRSSILHHHRKIALNLTLDNALGTKPYSIACSTQTSWTKSSNPSPIALKNFLLMLWRFFWTHSLFIVLFSSLTSNAMTYCNVILNGFVCCKISSLTVVQLWSKVMQNGLWRWAFGQSSSLAPLASLVECKPLEGMRPRPCH